jgi:hypothetical protein
MQKSKRKKLDAEGWKLGSTKELLELSREEEDFIELRLKLADGPKARRQASGMSQVNLAKALKSNQSRVAKNGSQRPHGLHRPSHQTILALGPWSIDAQLARQELPPTDQA